MRVYLGGLRSQKPKVACDVSHCRGESRRRTGARAAQAAESGGPFLMLGTTIQARRDRDGRHVLCGRLGPDGRYCCGERLLYFGGSMLRHNWQRGDDGVWTLRPAARKRRHISHVVASGNYRQSPEDAVFERERLHHGDEGGRRPRGAMAHQMTVAQPDMLLRCPKCGGINSLRTVLARTPQRK